MRGRAALEWTISLAAVLFTASAPAQVTIRDPGTYVVDRAGLIDSARATQIEGWLRELEQKTTAQVKLLIVPSTDGEDPFTFGFRHVEAWKLGQSGKDNGALIVLVAKSAAQAGNVKIHTGYGLESVLPDSWCGSLARKMVAEHLRYGRYAEGALLLTVAVANKVADAANVTLTGIPDYRFRGRRIEPAGAVCSGLFPLLVMLLVVSTALRRRRYRRTWGGGFWPAVFWGTMLGNMMGGSRRSSWGGGFGGGMGRGFGGFGGGSFGGGGRFGGGGGGASW